MKQLGQPRRLLRVESSGAEGLVADNPTGGIRIDKRMLEQSLLEFLREDPHDRTVELRLREFAGAHRLDQHVPALGTAEFIDTGFHGFHEARAHRETLDAPGHRKVGK